MTRVRLGRLGGAAFILTIAINLTSSTAHLTARAGQQPPDDGIAPSAMNQIEALLREKETRTPAERKIDSQLLYAARMQRGLEAAPGVATLNIDLPKADDGHVIVDVKARLTSDLIAQVNGLSSEVLITGDTELQMHVSLDEIEALAAQPDVIFVQPQQRYMTSGHGRPAAPPAPAVPLIAVNGAAELQASMQNAAAETNVFSIGTGQGRTMSEADVTHKAAVFRGLTGINGAGVTIGVLSNGVAHLADAQASGDLGTVHVLPGQAGTGDEGTAMLELVHDMAPGAELFFATANPTITQFATNIRALRDAGCTIIIDDVFYFVETPFQDGQAPSIVSPTNGGAVIQAVHDVTATGVLYFSSAGNSGNLDDSTAGVWEGDFAAGATAASPVTTAGTLHRFTGTQDYDVLTLASGPVSLYWSDALGASGNDYDLFVLNSAGTAVFSSSTNIQDGNDDPYEQASPTTSGRVVIVRKTGAASRFLHLNTNRGVLSVATAGQTHGHAATSDVGAFGVAATSAQVAFPNVFGAAHHVETFSSDGPRRIFYNSAGAQLTPGNVSASGGSVLQKPDVTAADGVSVTGAGNFSTPFYGTSAAAPNAGAIAALFKAQNPGLTSSQLRSMLLSSAIDIEGAGFDRDSGAGIVMATPTQPGCTLTLGGPYITGPSAVVGAIGITASTPTCTWVVFSTVPWMTFVTATGTGTGSPVVKIAPNHGPTRVGTVKAQGGSTATITQGGTAATPFTTNTVVPIPDSPGPAAESTLVVSGLTQPIANVSVSVYITHTFDSDLVISLVAPDGTTVPLSTTRGSSGDNYGSACSPQTSQTTFDDNAATPIKNGVAPFVGTFQPEQPLSRLIGHSGNGTWRLRVLDTANLDTGSIQCWTLNANQGPVPGQPGDFTGDGHADLSVFRPSIGQWFVEGTPAAGVQFGLAGDIPVPGDYNGDGLIERAVYRPSTGQWFESGIGTVQYGRPGDIPIPADYNGDGTMDVAVFRTTDNNNGVWLVNVPGQPALAFGVRGDIPVPGDYDGDGRADFAVYRPSTGQWFVATASTGYTTFTVTQWGIPGDIPVRADFDGDNKLDFVVFRPSNGTWYISGSNSSPTSIQFGLPGDMPVSLDRDGDGRSDLLVWRPSNGQWFIRNAATNAITTAAFGLPGDIPTAIRPQLPSAPVSDFDGDGVSDLTVFRASSATWFTRFSSTGFSGTATTSFGLNGDVRVNGDYDGDHRSDLAVYRPSTGQWFVWQTSTGVVSATTWGLAGDVPMPADYDGDGRTDIAVWRPSTGQWFVINSSTGGATVTQWGLSQDQPVAADFDGDGRADLAVYRPSSGQWFLHLSTTAFGAAIVRTWGIPGDVPAVADFDGDGRADIVVYRPSGGLWLGIDALTGGLVINRQFGLAGDVQRAARLRRRRPRRRRGLPAVIRHLVHPAIVERLASAGSVGAVNRRSAAPRRRRAAMTRGGCGRHLTRSSIVPLVFVLACAPVQTGGPANGDRPQPPAPSEKDSRTAAQRKIDSQLLYELYRVRGEAKAKGVPDGPTGVQLDTQHRALVDVRAEVTPALQTRVTTLGATIVSTSVEYRSIIAWVPLTRLEQIAGEAAVHAIVPAAQATTVKSPTPSKGRPNL